MRNKVDLLPLRSSDYRELYEWSTNLTEAFRWRFGGRTPSPEEFAHSLWMNVLAQYLVVDENEVRQGLVVLYDADHVNGHVYIGVQGRPSGQSGIYATLGLLRLIDHAFRHWPFRKIYAEIPEYNVASFSSISRRGMQVEGRLLNHIFYKDRYWDLITHSLTRETWEEVSQIPFAAIFEKEK